LPSKEPDRKSGCEKDASENLPDDLFRLGWLDSANSIERRKNIPLYRIGQSKFVDSRLLASARRVY